MQVISEQGLRAWLNTLLIDRVLIAPVAGVNGTLLFQPVEKADTIAMSFSNSTFSPKEAFFPRSEVLLKVVTKDGVSQIVPTKVEKETVIFGIRPCDARGIALIDKPFLSEPVDQLYQQKRARTALVGLACAAACKEGFCTSMGSGPNDPAGLDVLLTPVSGGYAVQAVTEKGKKLLAQATLQERDVKLPKVPEVAPVNAKGVTEAVRKHFNDAYWDRLADRCLHCNACSYVCPTCYCFDVRDYPGKQGSERVRSWESCQAPGFTKAAGGHNPRPTKGGRLRQRFAHKLLYFPDIFGSIKCTGCGRCVRNCPVNIDIREVINDMTRLGA